MELSTPDNTDLWKGNADKASAPHNTERQKQQKADQRKGKKGGRRRRVKKKKSDILRLLCRTITEEIYRI